MSRKKSDQEEQGLKVICRNRKAGNEYFLEDFMEAGIVLLGPEVKSLREGRASLVDSYAKVKKGEIFIYGLNITPYSHTRNLPLDPLRVRKLLMHKAEIKRLIGKSEEKGYTLIPTKVYFKKGLAKVEIALARGKKKYDKRQALKQKELKREVEQFRKERKY